MDQVTVTRTIATAGITITESATARLPDDLTLDSHIEALRRAELASALFSILPSLQNPYFEPPCPPKPTNLPN